MKAIHLALLFLPFLPIVSCKKKEETAEEEPTMKVDQAAVDFAVLHTEAKQHPSFPEVMKHPAVVAATQANHSANQAYDKAKYSHPDIEPLYQKALTLSHTDPERSKLFLELQAKAKELPELQPLLAKAEETMIDLMEAYGTGFESTADGKELGAKFKKITASKR